nr:hypothetical protein [uncultured Butyrivibrio sp.]
MKTKNPVFKAVLALIALFLMIMFLVSYANSGKEYVADSKASEVITDEGKVHYENIPITYERQMPNTIPEQIRMAVVELPVEVIRQFIEDEWKIAVVSRIQMPDKVNIDAVIDETDKVIGVTDYQTKTIQILYDDSQQCVTTSLMHELCHYCDKYYGEKYFADDSLYDGAHVVYLVSFTRDFRDIYQQYRDLYVEYEKAGIAHTKENRLDFEYPVSNSEEFIACSLKDFFLYPQYLQQYYPDLYRWYQETLVNAVQVTRE